jgi:putative spermidine/putrescine transport system ATP-binding protein
METDARAERVRASRARPSGSDSRVPVGARGQSGTSVDLRALTKSYGSNQVVKAIDLRIEAGEFMTFLGPSGSGKTTTLSMIAGFADVSSGEIRLGDQPIASLPPNKRDIGMVFQNYALFPHMTAAQNIAFPLKRRKWSRAAVADAVAAALSLVHLDDYGDRLPRELSGGQQQRVAFARSVVFEPRLLLMDEPLGALDKNLRESLQSEIRRMHRRLGITFVFVTHDQSEALAMSDRIAVFNEGSIVQVGSPTDLYERPTTRFVAEFLGESNIIAGTIEKSAGGFRMTSKLGVLHAEGSSAPDSTIDPGNSVVALRPEHIELHAPTTEVGATMNAVCGRVVESTYSGASRKLEVAGPGGQVLICREQSGKWTDFREGDEVLAAWEPVHGILVRDRTTGAVPGGA